MIKKLTGLVVVVAAILTSGPAQGQNVFNDLLRERRDEHRLRHDYRVMQRDLAHGNTAAAQYDMQRIQQDQARLARDQAQLNLDRNGGRPISPSAINPGFNPASGGQGSLSAAQSPPSLFPQSLQPPAPSLFPPLLPSISPPRNPPPSGAGLVPPNPLPGLSQSVAISNPTSTGATLSFVFGGQTYSIDAGQTREFSVTAPTLLIFNRGGQAGVARYTLTGGNSFEFKSDSSGWYVAPKRSELADLPQNPVPSSLPLDPAPLPSPDAAAK